MEERANIITMKGNSLTLVGKEIKIGEPAPKFKAVALDLSEFEFTPKGKIFIISSVPSLDTPVCDLQTKRFNQEATEWGDDIEVITISMDLPFAQKRWCGAANVNNIKVVSDHKYASFGNNWGMLIKELRLLARGVFIIDREGIVRYSQLVNEVTHEPNYEEVLKALKEIS